MNSRTCLKTRIHIFARESQHRTLSVVFFKLALFGFIALASALPVVAETNIASASAAPMVLTTQQDHRKMMDLLGMTSGKQTANAKPLTAQSFSDKVKLLEKLHDRSRAIASSPLRQAR